MRLLSICLLCSLHCHAAEAFDREKVLVVQAASGSKTPVGGVGVYDDDYGRRVGTVETLGDGSTVLRGDFGRVETRTEPRLSDDQPTRITVRDRR